MCFYQNWVLLMEGAKGSFLQRGKPTLLEWDQVCKLGFLHLRYYTNPPTQCYQVLIGKGSIHKPHPISHLQF